MRISIINGPNLDRLGTREPERYGDRSMEDVADELRGVHPQCTIDLHQCNDEGALVVAVREKATEYDAIIINPGGYSHTSVALRDAIQLVDIPVIEVHISNIHDREHFRQNTITGAVCTGVITGFGVLGYRIAVQYLATSS